MRLLSKRLLVGIIVCSIFMLGYHALNVQNWHLNFYEFYLYVCGLSTGTFVCCTEVDK